MAITFGIGTWTRIRRLADTGRPIAGFMPDLDGDTIEVTYGSGPNQTFTFAQTATFLAADLGEPVTEQDVADALDAALRWWSLSDGTPSPEGGWLTAEMPGRGGRT